MGSVIYVNPARWTARRPAQTSYPDLKIKYLKLRYENSALQAVARDMLVEIKTLKARLAALGY